MPAMRLLAAVPRVLTPLALLAAVLGLVVPSPTLAAHSDLLLALLVLATALGISFADLARLREHARAVLVLSLLPLPLLVGAAWLLGRPFAPVIRDGLLAVGLSSSEIAAVGLVALADGRRPVGFAHIVFHPSTWSKDSYCYLEDLYVDPTYRGTGTARQLIEAVYAEADRRGAVRTYWETQEFNSPARSLYDVVAHRTSFIIYERA